jgi:hypothetical protein
MPVGLSQEEILRKELSESVSREKDDGYNCKF